MQYVIVIAVLFVLSIIAPMIVFFRMRKKFMEAQKETQKGVDEASQFICKSLEHYKKEIEGELKTFRVNVKQYTKHKVASPQQLRKAKKKMKVVKSAEA